MYSNIPIWVLRLRRAEEGCERSTHTLSITYLLYPCIEYNIRQQQLLSLYSYLESSSVSFQCRQIRRHMDKASSSTKVISLSLIGSFKPLSPPLQTAALPHGAIAYYSLWTMLIWRCYVNLTTPCDKLSTAYFRAGAIIDMRDKVSLVR